MKTIALASHRDNGEYCARALIEHNCPQNHDYTQPVKVPETHTDLVGEVRHHLFLNDVGQESDKDTLANIAELNKRYLQVGQYIAGHDVETEGSSVIVEVVR